MSVEWEPKFQAPTVKFFGSGSTALTAALRSRLIAGGSSDPDSFYQRGLCPDGI